MLVGAGFALGFGELSAAPDYNFSYDSDRPWSPVVAVTGWLIAEVAMFVLGLVLVAFDLGRLLGQKRPSR